MQGSPGTLWLQQRPVPRPHVKSAVHGDRTILLDLDSGRYWGLDEVGTRVWALLKRGVDVADIVGRLEEEYDVARATLEADLEALVRQFEEMGVIRWA